MRCVVYFCFLLWLFPVAGATEEIKNGKDPLGPTADIKFREIWRLGAKDGEHYQWQGAMVALDVNKSGQIFITDPGNERVLHLDEKGRLIKTIGGDGSYFNLASFQILADQTAISLENVQGPSRITRYDTDINRLNRQRNTDSSFLLQHARFSPDGNRVAAIYFSVKQGRVERSARAGILNGDLEVEQVITSHKLAKVETNLPIEEFWVNELSRHLGTGASGLGIFAFDDQGNIYHAISDQYKVVCLDKDLQPKLVFSRAYDAIYENDQQRFAIRSMIRDIAHAVISPHHRRYVDEDVVARAMEKASISRSKHPILGLITMPGGSLLVIHDYDAVSHQSRADIFTQDGIYRGFTTLKGIQFSHFWANPQRLLFRGNKAYAIERVVDPKTRESSLELALYEWELVARP